MSELAFTVNGDTFDVPATVTSWRVRRLKPRGAPELVYSRDGRPLTLPIEADLDDLHEAVSLSGKYRLDPIGEDGKSVENVPAAYIQITKGERNSAGEHVVDRGHDSRNDNTMIGLGQAVIEAVKLNAEALRQNAEISMRAVDRLPQLMEAMTTMLNVATGTGLHAVQQRELAQPGLRNAANDNGDDEADDDDDLDGDSRSAFPLPAGLDINKIVSQVASDVVNKLIERFSGKMPSLGSVLDMRKAYAEGQQEREAKAAVPTAPSVGPSAPPQPTAPVSVPTDAASMAHFFAVKNALNRDEQMLVVALANELPEVEQAIWFGKLRSLSVPDAVAAVRATLADLHGRRQSTWSLTRPSSPGTAPAQVAEPSIPERRTS